MSAAAPPAAYRPQAANAASAGTRRGPAATGGDSPDPRRDAVLSAVLDLLVGSGPGFSMADVARTASCSKETLYRWFGDRDGLLAATVQWQAAKVRMPELPDGPLDRQALRVALAAFAASWVGVITGPASVGLNRMAISAAASLGPIVLEHGPRAMGARLAPVFAQARAAGLMSDIDEADAFRLFFGLTVAELQLRCLLGDPWRPDPDWIVAHATKAADRFIALTHP